MSRILKPKGPPECPLCLKPMREVWYKDRKWYACTRSENCMIAIPANDPAVGRWRELLDPSGEPTNGPVCPVCGHKMRMFYSFNPRMSKIQCSYCLETRKRLVQVIAGPIWALPPQFRKPLTEGT